MKITTDIWFVGFLLSRGKEIDHFEVIRRGKGSFHFNLSDDEWKSLRLEFSQSAEFNYKVLVEKVKDLTF